MSRHITWRDHLGTGVELLGLAVRYRGNLQKVNDHLQRELEWDRYCARHGLPPSEPPKEPTP